MCSIIFILWLQIVETMSYTDNVAKFMGSLDSVYEAVPAADLELLLGPTLERMRSMPGSPIGNTPLGRKCSELLLDFFVNLNIMVAI